MKDTIVTKNFEVKVIAPGRFSEKQISDFIENRVNVLNNDGDNSYNAIIRVNLKSEK